MRSILAAVWRVKLTAAACDELAVLLCHTYTSALAGVSGKSGVLLANTLGEFTENV
jgi:urea transporter